MSKNPLLVLAILLSSWATTPAANWPQWRGPRGDGISDETDLPTHWNREENVRWRAALPEPGNSTPVVWENRVFVTQPMAGGERRTVICFDRESGTRLWQSGVDAKEMERTHRTNPYCSPSPVCDGERVIAWFGSSGLVAFDLDGDELWSCDLGPVDHVFGYGGSPVLHGDLCFLNFGPGESEFAVAVNKYTGEIVWQWDAPRPNIPNPRGGDQDVYGMWSTPIIVDDTVVFCFRDTITAREPQTGLERWICNGVGPQMKASPVAGEGVVVALGGMHSSTVAVRVGGTGNVTDSHVLWRNQQAKSRLGTGVIHEEHLYANRSNGVVECIELRTGMGVWQKRQSGAGETNDTWSSLLLADGKIYAINQSADVFVLAASPEYQLIATNSLGEHTNSSIAASQGNLFIRTHDALWCIGDD